MNGRITRLSAACVFLITATAVSGGSEVTYLASSFETLYRVTPEREIESWDFDLKIRAMHRDPETGKIIVLGDAGGAGAPATVYLMDNPLSGTPRLTPYTSLSRQYGSITRIGEDFYGFSSSACYTIDLSDPINPIETYVGDAGVRGTSGAAYDPASDTLYMLSFKYDIDALYTVDPDTAAASWVGGLGVDTYDISAEWFDGKLYAAAQNGSSRAFEIGTVDVSTGQYSSLITVASGASFVATALTVIPEPTTLSLLLVGSVAVLRQRRP